MKSSVGGSPTVAEGVDGLTVQLLFVCFYSSGPRGYEEPSFSVVRSKPDAPPGASADTF